MKYKIILVPFPFDDLSATKVRPAICLTDIISSHNHIVIAFITSQTANANIDSDILLLDTDSDFPVTGLRTNSAIRLHRLVTIDVNIISRLLGELPISRHTVLKDKVKRLFDL